MSDISRRDTYKKNGVCSSGIQNQSLYQTPDSPVVLARAGGGAGELIIRA